MRDLTKGSPAKQILLFALPICLGNIFQLFYSLVDTRIVGRYLGSEALAAVGATNSLNSMLIGFLMGMTNGFAILVARFFGAKEEKRLKKSVAATFLLGSAIAVAFMILCIGMLRPILSLLRTPENILPLSMRYIRIILFGMLLTMLYNASAAVLRAIGDTVTPLLFLILSTVLNVFLDLFFVVKCSMGVEGAAAATVLAQGVSVLLCLIYMFRKYEILRITLKDFRLEGAMAKEMLATGGSMAFMISLVNIGSVVLQSAINGFGESIIVAHTAARKLTEVFMLPFSVFGTTMATYCSQNLGAQRYERLRKGVIEALLICAVCCGIVVLVTYTIAPALVRAVTGMEQKEVIDTASLYLRINTVLYFVTAVICILRNALQGIGEKMIPIFSSFLELIGKVLIAMFLAPRIGYMGVMISEPLIWCIMVIPLIARAWKTPLLRKMTVEKK
ncbi:MAG: MATE family efflux transporter [Lachnospiraceae bacterium]